MTSCFRLFIAVVVPALAWCGEPNRSWDQLVKSLHTGQSVVVTRTSSTRVEGRLLGITAESINVQWHGRPEAVPRDDVYRVRRANIRMTHTFLGMGVGAGGGMIAGAAGASHSNTNAAAAAGVGSILGVAIGAAIGGALPIGEPLYEKARKQEAKGGN